MMLLKQKYLIAGLIGATAIGVAMSMNSCVSIPRGANGVKPFEKEKYLGTWYEIARFDFRFEKGLSHVTATYSVKDENTIRVDNKGYEYRTGKWKESIGKAKFVAGDKLGRLKVSFFGPFYAGYNVIAIDEQYRYALVAGNNLDYYGYFPAKKPFPWMLKTNTLQKQRL
jgi:apolipoprotein D and lipocalin family protein